jgi:Tol biopolymer transport system component
MKRKIIETLLIISILPGCSGSSNEEQQSDELAAVDTLVYEGEKNLTNVIQLTFGADNAEAYWSFSGEMITFQSNNSEWGVNCDQIFFTEVSDANPVTQKPQMISNGLGRTTCPYFMPGDSTIIFASTHHGGNDCPPEPDRSSGKYVWPVYSSYDLFIADLKGNIITRLTDEPGYDAEATLSPKGDKIVFTSDRSGDLELYIINTDGRGITQITNELGYDGGAFFSPDGTKLVFRASRPKTEEEISEYKNLLSQGLVEPTMMELFVCNIDGSNMRQITNLGKANWAPFYHPSGRKIIFSSNHHGSIGFQFNLFMINEDGSGLEQITFDPVFDSFPMFSPDGKRLIFSSNRNNKGTRDTNLFIAEWVEN